MSNSKNFFLFLFVLVVGFSFVIPRAFAQGVQGQQDDQLKEKEDVKYVKIGENTIDGLSEEGRERLRRLSLSSLIRNEDWEVLLGEMPKNKVQGVQILELRQKGQKVTWGEKKIQGHNLVFELVDYETGNVVRRVREERVVNRQFLYIAGEMLQTIFDAKLTDEVDSPGLQDQAPTSSSSGGDASSSSESEVSQEGPELPEASEQELQAQNPQQAKEPEEEDEKEDEKKSDKPKKKINSDYDPTAISDFESPDLDLKKQPPGGESRGGPSKFYQKLAVSLDYETETLKSTDIIDVDNRVQRAGFQLNSKMYLTGSEGNILDTSLSYLSVVSDSDFDFGPRLKIKGFYTLNSFSESFHVYFGPEYESFYFVNLGVLGGGLQSWNNKFIWATGGLRINFEPLLGIGTEIFGQYATSFFGTTDFGPVPDSKTNLEGTKITAGLTQRIWRNYHLAFKYETFETTAVSIQGIENSHEVLSFSIVYR